MGEGGRFRSGRLTGRVALGLALTVVTAGTGTSVVPLRRGAPPDWWLLAPGP